MPQVHYGSSKAAADSPPVDKGISPRRCDGIVHPLIGLLLQLRQRGCCGHLDISAEMWLWLACLMGRDIGEAVLAVPV